MTANMAGGFEYRGRAFRFEAAQCSFDCGELYIEARGDRCWLSLAGIPFKDVATVTELAGKVWEPTSVELARYAEVFASGGLKVRRTALDILNGRFECRRYDAEKGTLAVFFRMRVRDSETGREREVDGVAYCIVTAAEESFEE